MTFTPGTTVRMKSGGPVMTVENRGKNRGGEERVWCRWFDEKNKQYRDDFAPDLLEEVTKAPTALPFLVNPKPPPY